MTLITKNSIIVTVFFLAVLSINITHAQTTLVPADVVIPNTQQCVASSGTTLSVGSKGNEVRELQRILNITPDTRIAASGAGSPGNETDFFGALTKNAVIKFQQKYAGEILVPASLSAGTGLVGVFTRTKVNQLCTMIVSSNMTQADIVASMSNKSKKSSTGSSKNNRSSESSQSSNTSRAATSSFVSGTIPVNTTNTSTGNSGSASLKMPTSLEWGAYSGYSAADLSAFEKLLGKQVKLKAVFTNWDDEFPTYAVSGLKDTNKTLVIYWEQYGITLDSIIAGDSDAYIREFAADAKSYGGQVILSPFHEMNGNWDPWGGTVGNNTPEKVVQAWKHIHDVFGDVSNVKFAWAVNNISVPDTAANAIEKYYPGDAYVDYVAVDGFNFGNPWQSFDAVFGKALTKLSTYKKPIYILSMASAEGTQKAAWVTDAFTVQVKKYPLLKGWIWFNEDKERDWRINSDASTLTAFKQLLP